MSIWGRRDGEPPAEETELPAEQARDGQAEAHDAQEPAAGQQAHEEPAPAFWRAQGEMPGRDPADAPPPAYGHVPPAGPAPSAHGEQESGEAPAPAMNEAEEPAVADPRGEAQEPAMSDVEQPGAAPEPTVTEVDEPSVAEPEESVVSASPGPGAGGNERPAAVAVTPQRWSEILVAFVDDPRGSVKMAADAVDEAIGEFVKKVRLRQRDLASTWQGAETDTERLRTALRDYRKLGQRVQQLDLGGKTGT